MFPLVHAHREEAHSVLAERAQSPGPLHAVPISALHAGPATSVYPVLHPVQAEFVQPEDWTHSVFSLAVHAVVVEQVSPYAADV